MPVTQVVAQLWGSAPDSGCLPSAAGTPDSHIFLVVAVHCHSAQQSLEGLLAQWAGLCQFGPFPNADEAKAVPTDLHVGGIFKVAQADGA